METRMQFQQARGLIRAKKYNQARKVLAHTDHPLAKDWLARLDRIAPASIAQGHPWHIIWRKVLEQPAVATFEALLDEPNISMRRSSLWVVAGVLGGAVIYAILSIVISVLMFGGPLYLLLLPISTLIAGIPANLFSFWVAIAVIQALSWLIGGRGSIRELAFTYAIISALYNLVATPCLILIVFQVVPVTFVALLLATLSLYGLILMVRATCAVNSFGSTKAAVVTLVGGSIGLVTMAMIFDIIRMALKLLSA